MFALKRLLALFLVALLALGPATAFARAGASSSRGGSSYSSMGSRGSQTYNSSPGAAPIQRSITPNTPGTSGWSSPSTPGYASGYGSYGGGGFMRGLAGGLFGAWIGSMLFGGSSYGYNGGAMHGGGFLGTLLLLFLLFWIGRMIWRSFGAGRMFAPGPGMFGGGMGAPTGYQPAAGGMQTLALGQPDLDAFGQILVGVQTAWGRGDVGALQRYCTPEMVSYFAELLTENASRGVANRVENVQLVRGEQREAWREGNVEYATALLEWSAIDYTCRTDRQPGDPDFLVEGDPQRPTLSQEVWTFRRSVGGRWLLSAIQQTA